MEKTPSFSAAMKATFALPGESIGAFKAELDRLTDADRAYFSAEMRKVGIPHTDPLPRK